MSIIRALEGRYFSKGDIGLYVYPSETNNKDYIDFCGGGAIESEDFVEVMFRLLLQSDVKFTVKDVNKVRERLHLNKIKKITSEKEVSKEYSFDKLNEKVGK